MTHIIAERFSEAENQTLYLADIGDGPEWYSRQVLEDAGVNVGAYLTPSPRSRTHRFRVVAPPLPAELPPEAVPGFRKAWDILAGGSALDAYLALGQSKKRPGRSRAENGR